MLIACSRWLGGTPPYIHDEVLLHVIWLSHDHIRQLLTRLYAQGKLKVSNRVTRMCEVIGKSSKLKTKSKT
jgi:hypothetical protein